MKTPRSGKWGDLSTRVATSIALVGIGGLAIWLGGLWFAGLVAIAVGLIAWELGVMAGSPRPRLIAVLTGLVCFAIPQIPSDWALLLVLLPVVAAQPGLRRGRAAHAAFLVAAILAGVYLVALRGGGSPVWLIWLLLVIGATDVFGYVAGRALGGPKFWPRISPKKTWSGTVAGWIAAAAVGLIFVLRGDAGPALVAASVAVSLASQMGDIAQSAFKRSVGVKDSSALLPGHGGVFDRFDGVQGGAVFLLLLEQVFAFPPVPA
jgi:phosphatidate cytidylyltransferase